MAFEDYYALFGVPATATETEIRSAYRRLVLDYHPDRKPNDPAAEARFKQISAAYKVLVNPGERMKYNLRYAAFQDSQRQRQRNEMADETAQAAGGLTVAKARPRREKPDELQVRYVFNAPVVQQADAVLGVGLGAAFAWFLGTWLGKHGDLFQSLAWAFPALPLALLGRQFGSLVEEMFGGLWDNLLPPWAEDFPVVFPTIGAIAGVAAGWIALPKLGAPLYVAGTLPAAFGAAIGGLLGASMGRAFLSVAESSGAKLIGSGVALLVGGGAGLLLSPIATLATYGLTFDTAFFDTLFAAGIGGATGGALAGFLGARRRTATALLD